MENNFLWNRILRYVGKRERCEKEVRDYIQRKISNSKIQIPKTEIEEIVEKLKNLDLVNEERFAKAYIHDSYELQHKGKNRIRYELTSKRVSELTINKYLDEINEEDEKQQALKFAEKKYEFMKKLPFLTVKRRLYGQLVRRGYQPQIALKTIDIILKKR